MSRSTGTALAPPYRRAVRLGRRRRAAARHRATCRCSARSCSRIRSRTRCVDLADYAAEWKWDGIRVQLVHAGRRDAALFALGRRHLRAPFPRWPTRCRFPRCSTANCWCAAAHQGGEAGGAASFNALQQRLGRKTVSQEDAAPTIPAFVRLYDVLILEGEDLRALPWERAARAARSADAAARPPSRFDLQRGGRGRPLRAPRRNPRAARATRRSRG